MQDKATVKKLGTLINNNNYNNQNGGYQNQNNNNNQNQQSNNMNKQVNFDTNIKVVDIDSKVNDGFLYGGSKNLDPFQS